MASNKSVDQRREKGESDRGRRRNFCTMTRETRGIGVETEQSTRRASTVVRYPVRAKQSALSILADRVSRVVSATEATKHSDSEK